MAKAKPSAPSSSAATASSIDWRSASDAVRVCDCGEGVQCPKERNPMRFMQILLRGWAEGRLVDIVLTRQGS